MTSFIFGSIPTFTCSPLFQLISGPKICGLLCVWCYIYDKTKVFTKEEDLTINFPFSLDYS